MYLIFISIAVVCVLFGVAAGYFLARRVSSRRVDAARRLSEEILEEAKKEAETIKKEAELKTRSEFLKLQTEMEKEFRQREDEIRKREQRLIQKEENIDRRIDQIDKKEQELQRKERDVVNRELEFERKISYYNQLVSEVKTKLEKVAGMTQEEAKKELKQQVIDEAKHESAKMVKQIIDSAKEEGEKEAKKIIAMAIQRYAGDYVSESTVSVVSLPNDEMKGRIIGREGRNIRAIEAATGVDVIIDDTPEAVIISAHNPVRREVARLSLEKLVADGRIHPARIEEVVQQSKKEIEREIREAGEKAIFDLGIQKIHPELVKLVGRLKYRTSFAQNIYLHSIEVGFIAGIIAAELGLDEKMARRAGLLHDIGKAVDHEVEGSHAKIGADLAKKYGEPIEIVQAIAQHHDDNPESILGVIVQASDALSAARPGARKEMLENYIRRLEELESIAVQFHGVQKAYAIQAGRELRVIVQSDKITDEDSLMLSRDIAREIESNLNYPGQVKVTVIRETRAISFAR